MEQEKHHNEPALAGRLYKLMNQTGINKSGLARICGVSPQAVGRWFTKGNMSKESAIKLSEALSVSLSWLLNDDSSNDLASTGRDVVLSERHRELLSLFDRLPESEQDRHLFELKSRVEEYDRLFHELLKTRNIK